MDVKAALNELAQEFEGRGLQTGTAEKEVSLVFLVKSQHVGMILGRGGQNIQEIKTISGANVSFDKPKEASDTMMGERKAHIQGTAQTATLACFLIGGLVQQAEGGPAQVNVVLTSQACGPIVGKGGSHLKELRATTSAKCHLEPQPHPALGGRLCNIAGETMHTVAHAFAVILQMETFGSPAGGNGAKAAKGLMDAGKGVGFDAAKAYFDGVKGGQPYDPGYDPTPAMAKGYGKGGMGKGYGKGGYDAYGQSGVASQPLAGARSAPQGGPGAKRQRTGGAVDLAGAVASMPSELGSMGFPFGDEKDEAMVEISVLLPTDFTGQIIGKGGAHLAGIRAATGAKIHIDREEIAPGFRKATAAGPLGLAIKTCYLLASMIRDLAGAAVLDLIVSNNCGGIVGKGGSGLRRLQEQHQVKVTLERDHIAGEGRRLTIAGPFPTSVTSCCYDSLRCTFD